MVAHKCRPSSEDQAHHTNVERCHTTKKVMWCACCDHITLHLGVVAFSALTLLVGRQERHPACKKTEWWGAGVVICLERGADLHTAQLMPLLLTVSCPVKSRLVLPFCYRLTWVVPEKGPLNGCSVV